MRKLAWVAAVALVIAAVGCSNPPPPPPGGSGGPSAPRRERTATPVPKTEEEAIRQLIVAEGEAVVQQDIDRLQSMWASDGVVTNANRTPSNASDDQTWKGWGAIRDRYVNIVFPSSPTFAEHPNIRVTITGDTATAIADTKIGVTNVKDNDRWTFRKMDGQWKITSLTFSMAPQ
jgi:ketosteroid isomerase-like protein